VTDPAVRSRVNTRLGTLARLPHVSEISSPYAPRAAPQIAASGRVAFANVTLDTQATNISSGAAETFVQTARTVSGRGLEVEVEGEGAAARAGRPLRAVEPASGEAAAG
jgi:RND superfamily putative drug exporter